MNQDCWSPEAYARFQKEREQPFFDLAELIRPEPDMRVVDLGCGTGALTRQLHDSLQAESTLGIDNSAKMLTKAEEHAGPTIRFEHGDILGFTADGDYDLVFSNAALHWVNLDHRELFARLTAAIRPGGQLAVHLPANHRHPSHTVAHQLATSAPFRERLSGYVRECPVLEPEEYATLLHRLGFREQLVRVNVYGHLLPNREEVVRWVQSSLLTDYEKRLRPEEYAEFLDRYREELLPQLADTSPYFFTFNRILIWARK